MSKGSRENAAANAAATHLAVVLGAAMVARRWDDGSANRMHDFYVEGHRRKIALEVTTIADSQRVGRDVRWSRDAPDGWVTIDGLAGCWLVNHEGDAEAVDVVRTLRVNLPRLEALGVLQADVKSWQQHLFVPSTLRPLEYEQLRALDLVGVLYATCVAHDSEALRNDCGGQVHVLRGFGVDRPVDRNFPVTVVNEQLTGPDLHRSDVQKLLAVEDATARHLWMWLELTEGMAMIRSFDTEGLPDADLDANGIDGVWLGHSPAPDCVAGHAWLRGLGWSEFSVPRDEVVFD